MPAKGLHSNCGKRHPAPGPGRLGVGDNQPFRPPCEAPADTEDSAVEVNLAPSQPEQLSLAHPNRGGQHPQGFQTIASRGRKERFDFWLSQGAHLVCWLLRRPDQRGQMPEP
jgi:hypothetical protein